MENVPVGSDRSIFYCGNGKNHCTILVELIIMEDRRQ